MPIKSLYCSSRECYPALICKNRRSLLFFTLGVVLVLTFLFVFVIYPRADITLSVVSQPLKTSLEVKLDAGMDKILGNLDIMPAQAINFSFKKPSENYLIKEEVDNKLAKKLNKNQILLPALVHYEEKEGDIFVSALAFKNEDMAELVSFKLDQVVASNKELMVNANDVLKYNVNTFKPNEKQGVIEVSIEKIVIPKLNLGFIGQQLANQPISEAEKQLKELEGVKEVKIELFGWSSKKMPLISQRIKLKLDTF